jgi:hypothetical protein
MNTTDPTFPLGTINTSTPSRVRRRTLVAIGAAAAIAITASSAAVQSSRDDTTRPTAQTVSEYDQLRDLANRGVIPRQALDPAPMTREELRDLVDRGVIPRQALHPAPMTDDQLQDLANRGVIPRQSLDPVPTTTPADG